MIIIITGYKDNMKFLIKNILHELNEYILYEPDINNVNLYLSKKHLIVCTNDYNIILKIIDKRKDVSMIRIHYRDMFEEYDPQILNYDQIINLLEIGIDPTNT